jgi:hypothetical protein
VHTGWVEALGGATVTPKTATTEAPHTSYARWCEMSGSPLNPKAVAQRRTHGCQQERDCRQDTQAKAQHTQILMHTCNTSSDVCCSDDTTSQN